MIKQVGLNKIYMIFIYTFTSTVKLLISVSVRLNKSQHDTDSEGKKDNNKIQPSHSTNTWTIPAYQNAHDVTRGLYTTL